VDKAKNEEEILYIIDKFDNRRYHGSNGALGFITDAYKKYPSDFRIVVRYLHVLINDSADDRLKNKKEIISLYNRIQDYCTNDRIRMYAKNLIIHYYKPLTRIENSGITAQDMYDIIDTMPAFQDSKEVLMSYMPIDELTIKQGCRSLIDELLYRLDQTITHYCFFFDLLNPELTNERVHSAIAGMELIRDIFNMVYTDGNFGKSWRVMIYTYGHLGELNHRIGKYDKAYENLRICAELAKKFDTMPNETERTALFFEGTTLNKQEEVAMYLDTSVCDQMTRYMTERYQLSDEFKNTPEFQSILDIMK
ncbi:MAG: hypothetical protein K2K42_01990, partial [Eubacterium sp.]|nr:hypothetical protein [Eubacterium sp.]